MRQTLSKHKFKTLATESFRNGLRLHFDSILLYKNGSYPSAFQLAVLALEEFSKSNWTHHYYYSFITNEGFPTREFEQDWLALLFLHPRKQKAFFGWGEERDYSPKFMKFVQSNLLEYKKQKATYVGLVKKGKSVDINGRISLPSQIKQSDSKQIISLLNEYLKEKCEMRFYFEYHFHFTEMDELLSPILYKKLVTWKHRSRLRKREPFKSVLKKGSKANDRWRDDCRLTLNYLNDITKNCR